MSAEFLKKNQHLLWRAGFGPSVEQWKQLSTVSPFKFYDALEKASRKPPAPFQLVSNVVEGLANGIDGLRRSELTKEQKEQMQKRSRAEIRNLNLEWMNEMVNSEQQLREKVAFFWHGHFACRNLNALYQQDLINIIRRNALGNFGTMLKEVSRSAAMLAFLNNQQNRKQKPNENFAREVMELFTMGRGNYTEQVVKEAARAFTGWQFQLNGAFVFRPALHDDGQKTVLGKTGHFDGDDILNLLLEQRQTARYITHKLLRFFVAEQPDLETEEKLAKGFYESGYEIAPLLRNIFTSDWFYQPHYRGNRIKSPVELLVGIKRTLPMELQAPETVLQLQKVLGQVLFYPPNVAGWPGGKNWIDSSSLMFRLRLPQLLSGKEALKLRPKSDDDQEMGRMRPVPSQTGQTARLPDVTINWKPVVATLAPVHRNQLLEVLQGYLWCGDKRASSLTFYNEFLDASGRERYIQTAVLRLMSTPEYQLC